MNRERGKKNQQPLSCTNDEEWHGTRQIMNSKDKNCVQRKRNHLKWFSQFLFFPFSINISSVVSLHRISIEMLGAAKKKCIVSYFALCWSVGWNKMKNYTMKSIELFQCITIKWIIEWTVVHCTGCADLVNFSIQFIAC